MMHFMCELGPVKCLKSDKVPNILFLLPLFWEAEHIREHRIWQCPLVAAIFREWQLTNASKRYSEKSVYSIGYTWTFAPSRAGAHQLGCP